jgi:hypothetical protein
MWISALYINVSSNFLYRADNGGKWEYNDTLHQLFIYLKKAYDSVRRKYYTLLSLSSEYPGN